MEKIIKEIKNMSDKKVIQAMLEKVILGQESRDELVEVFTSMAAWCRKKRSNSGSRTGTRGRRKEE